MPVKNYKIELKSASREGKYKVYNFELTDGDQKYEHAIYDFDWETNESEGISPLSIMSDWLESTGGKLPKEKYLVLANGGKIPVNDIDAFISIKDKTSDLVRTNVTIAAPLYEWAKLKAKNESTSFSDLVSRGLQMLKESKKEVAVWFKEQGVYFRKKLGDSGSFEVTHYLPNNYSNFDIDTLKTSLQNAELHRTGWPIGVYINAGENSPKPQEDGIKAEYSESGYLSLDFWYVKTTGEFYFSRNLESDSGNGNAEPGKVLFFDTLIWRIAESLEHCIAYYKNLGISSSESVNIKLSLYGLENRVLSAWNPGRAFTLSRYGAGSDRCSWETELKLSELEGNLDEIIYDATKKLLVMFDFFVPNRQVVQEILDKEYRKSRM
jgi:hypothetical protein